MSIKTVCVVCGSAVPTFMATARGVCSECVICGGDCRPIVPRTAPATPPIPAPTPASATDRETARAVAISKREAFAVASAGLGYQQRDDVLWYVIARHSMAQIAAARSVSISAVSQSLKSAFTHLRRAGVLSDAA